MALVKHAPGGEDVEGGKAAPASASPFDSPEQHHPGYVDFKTTKDKAECEDLQRKGYSPLGKRRIEGGRLGSEWLLGKKKVAAPAPAATDDGSDKGAGKGSKK